MKSTVLFVVLAVLTVGLLIGYQRAGWDRMESACTTDGSGDPTWRSVEYRWWWIPPGFQCTYDNGCRRTSLWF